MLENVSYIFQIIFQSTDFIRLNITNNTRKTVYFSNDKCQTFSNAVELNNNVILKQNILRIFIL